MYKLKNLMNEKNLLKPILVFFSDKQSDRTACECRQNNKLLVVTKKN